MVFESRNLGPSASNLACGSTKNMPHRAGCDLRLRSRVASTTPKTCFLVQYRHCELRNFKNHDPRNRNREMIVSRGANKANRWPRRPFGAHLTAVTYHCLLLFVVCAFPERCLHISSRCLHTSSPLSASQSPSVDTDTAH